MVIVNHFKECGNLLVPRRRDWNQNVLKAVAVYKLKRYSGKNLLLTTLGVLNTYEYVLLTWVLLDRRDKSHTV